MTMREAHERLRIALLELAQTVRQAGGVQFFVGVWVGFAITAVLAAFGLYP